MPTIGEGGLIPPISGQSPGSLEEALIQLQYALGDYYSCGKRAAEFSPLDASLCVLREACVAALNQISRFGAEGGPKDYRDKSERSIFQNARAFS